MPYFLHIKILKQQYIQLQVVIFRKTLVHVAINYWVRLFYINAYIYLDQPLCVWVINPKDVWRVLIRLRHNELIDADVLT